MASENYEETRLDNIAPRICALLKVKGCVVLTLNEDDTIGMTSAGVNHSKANELLSVGIHINLTEHDEKVRAGAAGPKAQRTLLAIEGGAA